MRKVRKLDGTWRGTYHYDLLENIPFRPSTDFTLVIKQGWFGFFKGSVTDDTPNGPPDTGSIAGDFSYPRISFTKKMPIWYVFQPDGTRVTFREFIIGKGYAGREEFPGPAIIYEGKFSEPHQAEGTWFINPQFIRLRGNRKVAVNRRTTGTWNMHFQEG